MTRLARYLLLTISSFFLLNGFAADHITCNLTKTGILGQGVISRAYTNIYTCTNTYPSSFPPIQLRGSIIGGGSGITLSGNCLSHELASGSSCQFNVSINSNSTGTFEFYLQVSVGSLYYLNLPSVRTTITSPARINWPGVNIGTGLIGNNGAGTGTFVANATDSSGHSITYTFSLSGTGTIVGQQNGRFVLSGININNPGMAIITASADDAPSVVGQLPIVISGTLPGINWPGQNSGTAFINNTTGVGSGSFSANAIDSSGHTVIYTFSLSGTGTIVGHQNGTFELSGINVSTPGTVTITATADDATSVPGAPITISTGTTPVISWPGSSSGNASVNSSGIGSGSYVANAIDNSGHPITYTFALSGAGTIIGSQNGTFQLNGINVGAPGTVTVTATSDDASPVMGTPIPIVVSDVPLKVISIYNNSTEVIYPVLESANHPADTPDHWMQAQFAITSGQLATHPFTAINQYRVYVNPTTGGIPPGGSVIISVPFYSDLVASPSNGDIPNQYIDWWNAGRIYLYDNLTSLTNAYNQDAANPPSQIFNNTDLICLSGSSACTVSTPFVVYTAVSGLPPNDPFQLTEYTFANVVTSQTVPYPIDRAYVDYDISSVDQTYLPVAMEPHGNNQVGYTGTIMNLTNFRTLLSNFVSTYGWPIYIGNPLYTTQRAPGAYNVLIGNQSLTQPSANNTVSALITNWNHCVGDVTSPHYADCQIVNALFQANYNNYHSNCSNPLPLTTIYLLQHLYGWVAFDCAGFTNDLVNTPGQDYNAAANAYQRLQYSGAFNPYVQLVHSPTYLNMNVYAFSIDDAVGNMNELGDGVVITVAGANGLPNGQPFNKNQLANINPGAPPVGSGSPYFSAYGICSSTATNTLQQGGSFVIQTVSYPCEITLQSSTGVLYHFTLTASAPFSNPPTSNYIQCNVGDTWCNAINIDFNTGHDVDTPAP